MKGEDALFYMAAGFGMACAVLAFVLRVHDHAASADATAACGRRGLVAVQLAASPWLGCARVEPVDEP